jgi:Uma2 family endonuclease
VQLREATVRRPDVAFISRERLQGVDRRHTPLATVLSLVIEIVSPTDRAADLMKEVSEYLNGVQAVWLFYPGIHRAYRYIPNRLQPEVFSQDHDFSEPELLPGFTLKIAEILNPSGYLP